ncbi:hypothetical protein NP493_976g00037 [Ridgeia piscesae]|uniref:Uncharacterized protein n=1 Tax=Ridgeia piscesae TaxID=27915 RepID=A0AAD9KIL1_RIDPI|nr:hypothetical protein NP493_976g00037 [Ridgeia piscesae]
MEYILGYSQFWSIFTVVQCNVLIVNLDFWTINNCVNLTAVQKLGVWQFLVGEWILKFRSGNGNESALVYLPKLTVSKPTDGAKEKTRESMAVTDLCHMSSAVFGCVP